MQYNVAMLSCKKALLMQATVVAFEGPLSSGKGIIKELVFPPSHGT